MSGTDAGRGGPAATDARSPREGIAHVRRLLRRHRFGLGLRLVALAGTAAAAAALGATGRGALAAFVSLVALGQIPPLVRFVERPERDLLRFLEGVRNDDLSVSFSVRRGRLPDAIRAAFADVVEAFRRVRSEREEQALYLQTVVRHVGVALVALRDDGAVALFNEAAARLLGLQRPRQMAALAARHPALAEALGAARAGGRVLVEVARDDQPLTLVVHTTRFHLGGALYTLASLQDIRPELEEKEIEAWQRLTRVLTHEIMNSIAPIASLAATASDLLHDGDGARAGGPDDGVREALRVIERRCEGLVHFVEAYRSLARLPKPAFRVVAARDLVGGVHALMGATAAERGVGLTMEVDPPGLDLVVDPELVEQALLNVLLNAVQAAEGRAEGRVALRARVGAAGRPLVEVTDNGPGILPDVLDRIFVPFFTTKAGGSGIGLSLARQIMRLHGGTLTARSTPDVETTFAFRF